MIKEIIQQWDSNKGKLEEWFRKNKEHRELEYSDIVWAIFTFVVQGYDTPNIREIMYGAFHGDFMYIIPKQDESAAVDDYLVTEVEYGTCSQCDALISIQYSGSAKEEVPTERQVKNYMSLALNIVQDLKPLDKRRHLLEEEYHLISDPSWI